MSISDIFSVFFEEVEAGSPSNFDDEEEDEDGAITGGGGDAESINFWAVQHQLIDEALNRSSSIEKRVRIDTEAALQKMHESTTGAVCRCRTGRLNKEHCRDCGLRDIAERLRELGYNSALCKSKWRRSPNIPSGEHSYVDVEVETKKSHVRVVIELNFRAEFEMARANDEYNSLVGRLPEVFVGKSEKLRNVVNIVCAAGKKCMEENRMHMAPWRKHKYMQSKWLGTCQRMPAAAPVLPVVTRVSNLLLNH